jgi:nucleotide-binding universal stress UspA family protein/hemerythrin-like domain-containing protein
MYRHLLVPVDATDLSIDVVAAAVDFAASAAARITFFQVARDPAASASGLLAKAEAAARAWGVPCESILTVSDKPATAIVSTARSRGCDLIFMASHGERSNLGMALASETLDVLMHAGLPVLVAATAVLQPPVHAIASLRDEHRSLAAVLHAWTSALTMSRTGGSAPDAPTMRAVVRFLERFEARHHPKETHLFARLRARTSSTDADLDEIERQHEQERLLLEGLAQKVGTLEGAIDERARRDAAHSLEKAVGLYAGFVWDHLGREEAVILPAARRFFTDADWSCVDEAFAALGMGMQAGEADKEQRRLFARIVGLAHSGAKREAHEETT